MNRGDWLIAVASVFAAQLFLLLVELLRGRLERRQRRGDQRSDFRRQTLIELQDAFDDLMRLTWEAHAFYQRKERVPDSHSREHRIASGRVTRLSSRVSEKDVREGLDYIQDRIYQAIREYHSPGEKYPYTAGATLASLDKPVEQMHKRLGELLRSL
jgi:hypothetical protein